MEVNEWRQREANAIKGRLLLFSFPAEPHEVRRQTGVRGKSRPKSLLGLASTKKATSDRLVWILLTGYGS